jgi:hypothetical protein
MTGVGPEWVAAMVASGSRIFQHIDQALFRRILRDDWVGGAKKEYREKYSQKNRRR